MNLGIQGINSSKNLTIDGLNETAVTLGLPSNQSFINRRIARAFDLVESNKVAEVTDGIFRVRSQFDEGKSYIVNVNSGAPSCNCPDGQQRTIHCKHRAASLLYLREREKESQAMKITRRPDGVFCWVDGNNVGNADYNQKTGHWYCGCMRGKIKEPCKHVREIQKRFGDDGNGNGGGNGSKVINECGSEHAKQLQERMNDQIDSHGNNGNGAHKAPSPQLDLSDPFQESESCDIDQIEGRRNGELTWKLRNGEVVISYKGIMSLSEKHHITFSEAIHDDTHTVIAKGRCGRNERVSGKPINGNEVTAMELAKRNAARQLLPLAEIKGVEKKAQLESEFDWQTAYAKSVEIVGTKANVDIIINDLVQTGKLRQDNPSGYNRTEWLVIHAACKEDVNIDGDNLPSPLPTDDDDNDIIGGGGVIAPMDEDIAEEIHCSICSRRLTAPKSRMYQIGPECRRKLGITGMAYLQDDNIVSDELVEASRLYHEEQFQKWVIRACLTLDALIPTKILRWLGNEWFGYRKAPILYYLSADGQLNRIDTYKRKLRHKVITNKGRKDGEHDEGFVEPTPKLV